MAIIIYHIKIVKIDHVFLKLLRADFTGCHFMLLALTQPVSNPNELGKAFMMTWSIICSLDNQFIKTGVCVPLKLRQVPEIQANDVS